MQNNAKFAVTFKEVKTMARGSEFVVALEPGVWLADGDGDPARTLILENAKPFSRFKDAKHALSVARQYNPFPEARVEPR